MQYDWHGWGSLQLLRGPHRFGHRRRRQGEGERLADYLHGQLHSHSELSRIEYLDICQVIAQSPVQISTAGLPRRELLLRLQHLWIELQTVPADPLLKLQTLLRPPPHLGLQIKPGITAKHGVPLHPPFPIDLQTIVQTRRGVIFPEGHQDDPFRCEYHPQVQLLQECSAKLQQQ